MGHELSVELTYEGQERVRYLDFPLQIGLNGANGELSERNKLRYLPVLLPEIKQQFTTTAEQLFSMHLNGGALIFDVTAAALRRRLPKALAKLDRASEQYKQRVQSIKAFVELAAKWEREGKQVRVEIKA